MAKVKIEKDIAAPMRPKDKWPLSQMRVGESFKVSAEEIHGLRIFATKLKNTSDFDYVTRKVPGGFRIWRVSLSNEDAA